MTQPLEGHLGSYTENIETLVGAPGTTYASPDQPNLPTAIPTPSDTPESGTTTGSPQAPAATPGGAELRAHAPEPRFAGLFSRFGEDRSKAEAQLGAEKSRFQAAVGPRRTFQDLGGEETLGRALRTDDPTAFRRAQEMAQARYTGPAAWDFDPQDVIGTQVRSVQERGQAGRTQLGTEAILRERERGDLSPGELRFEARHLREDPTHRAEAERSAREGEALAGAYAQSRTQAQELAEARAREENEIRELTQSFLRGERGALETDWAEKIARNLEARDLAARELSEYQQTGDLKELQDLQRYADTDVGQFYTQAQKDLEEGRRIRAEILGRYPELEGVPLLTPTMRHGRESYLVLPQEWKDENAGRYTPEAMAALERRALERQRDLVEAGFSSRPEIYLTPELSFQTAQEGKYGNLLPMSFAEEGDEFEPADPRNFIRFDPGVSPTRENVSSKEQRAIYNQIQRILQEADRVEDPSEAPRAAQLVADVGRYLEEETAEIQRRRNTLDEREQEWAAQLRAARKAYKKLEEKKRKKKIGKITGTIGAVLGAPIGGPGPLGATGGYIVGSKIGEALG